MRRLGVLFIASAISAVPVLISGNPDQPVAAITIDYPAPDSVFPPDFAPPNFLWRDSSRTAAAWRVEVSFARASRNIEVTALGEPVRIGPIDQRAVAATNELPKLTPREAESRTWVPDDRTWAAIRSRAGGGPVPISITGFGGNRLQTPVSRGQVIIRISKDPVGAPIFYRDVPLMPSELEKGVIKPLPVNAIPLIAWRLRNVAEPRSRLLMDGLPTCANCHSFSLDGKTLGMDLDGPQNDKGMYAIAPVAPRMSIRNEDVIEWNSFRDQPSGQMRVGFMSQVSPDGRYVVTTVATERDEQRNYYVANFKDYRFLQVFYATRGVLVWYDRRTGQRFSLPGADDHRFVQTNAVWSPDGKYLVFARAEAKDAYREGDKLAGFANDPNETQIRYDLHRIPFNEGRGGRPEPVAGASNNGMSNAFPKVSPDGRWIVFVQCRNGLLMRPDGKLYIVPFEGGQARLMRANTPLMNSWHSFSPNGRWLVFSSKGRSPYTQMFLTHIDEQGNDSPPILIENATAANRAVNIPEFVNIAPDGLARIDMPAVEFYRRFNRAWDLMVKEKRYEAAIGGWKRALEISPGDAKANVNLGAALAKVGRLDEAVACWRKALESGGRQAEVHRNLGSTLLAQGKIDEAIMHLQKALEISPADVRARVDLGTALVRMGKFEEAIPHLRRAGELDPRNAIAHNDLGVALLRTGKSEQAVAEFRQALNAGYPQAAYNLGNALYSRGATAEAVDQWRQALRAEPDNVLILNQIAWVLATSPDPAVRNGAEALKFARHAAQGSGGGRPAVLDALAASYAETGRFPDAVETARRALALAAAQNQPRLAEGMKARLALYESGKPYREGGGR